MGTNLVNKSGYTREQKVTWVRECDMRSVANMFAVVYAGGGCEARSYSIVVVCGRAVYWILQRTIS